jgi:hypothetical protein
VWAKQRALGRNILRKAAILNRIRRQSICALETVGTLGRVFVEQETEQEQLHLARLKLMYGSHDSATQPISKEGAGLSEVIEKRRGELIRSGGSSPASSRGSPSLPLKACDVDSEQEYRSPNDAYASVFSKPPRPAHLPLPPSPLGLSNYDAFDLEDDIPDPYAHLDEEYEAEEHEEHELESAHPLEPSFPWKSEGLLKLRFHHSYEAEEEQEEFELESAFSLDPPFPCSSVGPSQPSFQQSDANVNVLDPEEPVMGDYDQVEEGADAIWPAVRQTHDRSTDAEPPSSSSPIFTSLLGNTTPNAVTRSHNASSSLSPTSSSPNFAGLYVTRDVEGHTMKVKHAFEIEKEQERQKYSRL